MSTDFFRTSAPPQTPRVDRYASLGLTNNPFPQAPGLSLGGDDKRSNGSIYEPRIRKEEQARFDSLFIPSSANPDAKRLGFIMDFATRRGRGIGKTAFLCHQMKRIVADWGSELTNGTSVLFASLIQPKPKTRAFGDLCRHIVSAVCDQEVLAKAMLRIRYFHGELPESVLRNVDDPRRTIGDDDWLRGNGIDPFWFCQQLAKTIESAGVNAEHAQRIGNFGHDREKFDEVFIEPTTDHFWRTQGASFVFDSLVRVFRLAGIDCGLLLIDELEKVVYYQNKSERRELAENLRYYLFDGDCECARTSFFRAVLTIHPYLQELLLPHWETSGLNRFAALSRELADRYTVYFNPINHALAKPLVQAYLREYRVTPSSDPDDLRPFDEGAIMKAVEHTKAVPGAFLQFLHEVVERAAAETKVEITADSMAEYAAAREPTEDSEGSGGPPVAFKPVADLQRGGLGNAPAGGEENV